ncbi:Flavin-linked sulfhydryl oxidase of the mitochondrial IMS [Lecanora helva]
MSEKVSPSDTTNRPPDAETKKAIPKGVVLGKDGKPCRSCTSFASWAAMTKEQTSSSPTSTSSSSRISTTSPSTTSLPTAPPPDCPPDVDALGRSTWTFLHTLSASYPTTPSPSQKSQMTQFLALFAQLYPCWHCAEDFQSWMRRPGNEPRVGGRGEFGRWMCEAHNEVNRKLGKKEFECGKWEERWRTGWKDGRCDE